METLSEKYDIRIYMDDIYAVYLKDNNGDYLFKGTLQEVNAWLDLQSKGFNIDF